jgi:DNA invertase Pin-like site-specific DNA recombinase
MMSDVKAGKIDRVLVHGVDRLSRCPQTALQLIDEIMENGSALISPINDFDTSTPSGKLKLNILKGFALR